MIEQGWYKGLEDIRCVGLSLTISPSNCNTVNYYCSQLLSRYFTSVPRETGEMETIAWNKNYSVCCIMRALH